MNSYRRRRCGKYALQGAVQSHDFDVQSSDVDVTEYLRVNEEDIVGRLGEAFGLHQCIKWYATMDIAFYRTTPDGEIQNTTSVLDTACRHIGRVGTVCRPYEQRLSARD